MYGSQIKNRFSLLLLEEADYYFEDFACSYYPPIEGDAAVAAAGGSGAASDARFRQLKGRLKLCSRSLCFEPDDANVAVLKFPFEKTASIQPWTVPLISPFPPDQDYFQVNAKRVVEMKENGFDVPYKFRTSIGDHKFSFEYVKLADVLPRIQKMFSISKLGRSERDEAEAALINEREENIKFDLSWLQDVTEKRLVELRCSQVTPLVHTPGRVLLTDAQLYWMPFNSTSASPVERIRFSDMTRVHRRRHMLRPLGLEILLRDDSSLFLAFAERNHRDLFYKTLMARPEAVSFSNNDGNNMTLRWQNGLISNFDYLMYLNHMADRTFNDLTQYPVFPWVLRDYVSPTLDLDDPSVYRDLSKPIGALDADRLAMFKERYREMPEPRFLYGTHYSTPGYVLSYLVRQRPELMLRLQNGKFDAPDRLFSSVPETWSGVLASPTDVKELIPEFYMPPGDFLVNLRSLDLGQRQNGLKVHDCALPPWARDARDFTKKMREALESKYVSDHLHEWIDLIFGYKQRGDAAVHADNVFYYLTYEGAVDIDAIKDPHERASIEAQINEFGQTPRQLFNAPHPQRYARAGADAGKISWLASATDDDSGAGAAPASAAAASVASGSPAAQAAPGSPATASAADGGAASRPVWTGPPHWVTSFSALKNTYATKLHRDSITGISLAPDCQTLFSTSQDTSLKLFSLEEKKQVRSVALGNLALSSCTLLADGKTALVGSWDNAVYMYSVDYGRTLDKLPAHDDAVSCLCVRNNVLLTGSWDSTIKVWPMTKRGDKMSLGKTATAELIEHETEVKCIDADEHATIAVSGSTDGTIVVWDLESQFASATYNAHGEEVTGVKLSPDKRRVLSCSLDGHIRVCDVDGSPIWSVDVGEALHCLETDGDYVMVGGEQGILHVYDLSQGTEAAKLRQTVDGTSSPIQCLSVARDASVVVAGCANCTLQVWSEV